MQPISNKLSAVVFLAVVCCLAVSRVGAAPAFTDIGANITGLTRSYVAWGDYDNDGDLDLIMSGRDASFTPRTLIYRNEGNGTFVLVPTALPGVTDGQVRSEERRVGKECA